MQNVSWLELAGRSAALVLAVVFFGGLAYLIKAVPLYFVMGIGIALIVWDLIISTRETAEKNVNRDKSEIGARR